MGHHAAFKVGAEAVVEQSHFLRRPVRGDNHLVLPLMQSLKSMEKFLLRALFSGDNIDAITKVSQ